MSIFPSFSFDSLSIFEIYPQSETPLLTQIAHLDWLFSKAEPAHLLPDTLICRLFYGDRIVFRVVNYRTNHSTSFSADVVSDVINGKLDVEVFCVLSKTLKLGSNHLLSRHSRRRQLLSSSVKKEYLSGLCHLCRPSHQIFPATFSVTIPPI